MKTIQEVRREFQEWATENMFDMTTWGQLQRGCTAEMADVFVSKATQSAYHGYMAGYVDGHNSNAKTETVSIED